MGFIILLPFILTIVGLISYFIARNVYKKALKEDDPNIYSITTIAFIVSFVILFVSIFIFSILGGAFSRGHPNYNPPQADSTVIDSTRSDSIHKIDISKAK